MRDGMPKYFDKKKKKYSCSKRPIIQVDYDSFNRFKLKSGGKPPQPVPLEF